MTSRDDDRLLELARRLLSGEAIDFLKNATELNALPKQTLDMLKKGLSDSAFAAAQRGLATVKAVDEITDILEWSTRVSTLRDSATNDQTRIGILDSNGNWVIYPYTGTVLETTVSLTRAGRYLVVIEAVEAFDQAVKASTFPTKGESYT